MAARPGGKGMRQATIPYRQADHGDFDEEWLPQRRVSGWWYVTGYLTDEQDPDRMLSYQVTLIRPRLMGVTPWVLHLALTDVRAKRHRFMQKITFDRRKAEVGAASLAYGDSLRLERGNDGMRIDVKTGEFSMQLALDRGKGAFWHGDDGVLVMGMPESRRERTVYYSYTNMPTTGEIQLHASTGDNSTLRVRGKSWFDRQWGPYSLVSTKTHWEWFSLRFFDDEEVMLFSFPQHPYQDGTYIDRKGKRSLVRSYTCTPKGFITVEGLRFSMGWDVFLPGIKEERYEIRPVMEGQMNLAYFELLAEIRAAGGRRVGMCMVELLHGVYNPGKLNLSILRKV
jgi:predicted secreted hydrolase